jgi:hypothetical protein
MAIVRLGLGTPSANTDTLLHTAVRQSIISVIATNKSAAPATIRVWIQPSTATTTAQYAYVAYDTVLPANNSLETFRVPLEKNDLVYVRASSPDVSFSINAIHESSGNYNKVFVSDSVPTANYIGDVWVSQALGYVKFWDGTMWVNAVPGSAGYAQNTQPSYPQEGQLWVDLDDVPTTIPGYPTVFYSTTQPTGLGVGDAGTVWTNSNNSTMSVWSGTAWTLITSAAKYQSSAPTSAATGQVWVDSAANLMYVYSGSTWILAAAPGSSYQSSAPSSPSTGTLWVNSSTGAISVWSGSAWVAVSSQPNDYQSILATRMYG